MTFCTGAQPHHAPTSTAHHAASLGYVLAFTRLEPDVAAGFAGHSDLVQEQVTLAHDAHLASLADGAPGASGPGASGYWEAPASIDSRGCKRCATRLCTTQPRDRQLGFGITPVALSGQCSSSIALERIVAVQLQLEEIQHE
jgi:hypothetical protein